MGNRAKRQAKISVSVCEVTEVPETLKHIKALNLNQMRRLQPRSNVIMAAESSFGFGNLSVMSKSLSDQSAQSAQLQKEILYQINQAEAQMTEIANTSQIKRLQTDTLMKTNSDGEMENEMENEFEDQILNDIKIQTINGDTELLYEAPDSQVENQTAGSKSSVDVNPHPNTIAHARPEGHDGNETTSPQHNNETIHRNTESILYDDGINHESGKKHTNTSQLKPAASPFQRDVSNPV